MFNETPCFVKKSRKYVTNLIFGIFIGSFAEIKVYRDDTRILCE